MNRGEPNDFYSRSCDLSGHEWGQHEAGTRCIWCGTYQLYITNAVKADRTTLLTKLRDEVERMKCEPYYGAPNDHNQTLDEVLALLEKAGGEG